MIKKVAAENKKIIAILAKHPEGLSRGKINKNLSFPINNKTLQRRMVALVKAGSIYKEGNRKTTKYFHQNPVLEINKKIKTSDIKDTSDQIFSQKSLNVLKYLEKPTHSRAIVSYKKDFLDSYIPNETVYVPTAERVRLRAEGERLDQELAAGTYARQICQKLLIDLSYNSSRLEGNTYSRLDTEKLVVDGITAEGKIHEDSVMIINHKEAILFLVENAEEITFNSFTICNLHNLLSQDLLSNPESCGSVRTIEVNIGKSTYKPLNNPHLLKQYLELIFVKAKKIENPFEQSFFVLVHLSYLQAFEDVNKRTARLACNIPFIKGNLCPLSFTDVPRDDYLAALLMIYEINNVEPMRELFTNAYLRSCKQYDAAKESLGEIDAYRIQYRTQRKAVMGQIIKNDMRDSDIEAHIESYCEENKIELSEKFIAMTLADLESLHAGAIIGLGITEDQFNAWKEK